MSHDHHHGTDEDLDDHDRGLAYDLPRLVSRRAAVGVLAGGIGSLLLDACGGDDGGATATSPAPSATTTAQTTTGTTTTGTDAASEIPEETAGPYPGDGSNGPNVLADSGVVRQDITGSFGGASGRAEGVATTVTLTLLDVAGGGTPLAGAAVYAWHCDRDGRYSLYDQALTDENYLRGVQESDADGRLSFTTIFPGAYSGRWPHIHFEVYESVDAATGGSGKLHTSQIALPQEICETVYATGGYEQSLQNLAQSSLDGDMVFSDGYRSQLATASGDAGSAIALALNVGV